jgi:hypothetical protein
MNISSLCCMLLVFIPVALSSQSDSRKMSDVYIDGHGVLRWSDSKDEVSLFGVNYTVPFAYSYRAHTKLGLSLKKTIDLDVEQMVRLGFDAFRVHVWDREISDSDGNILKNDHLDLFDYLLAKLAEHNIKSILTPIAWWGNGWPEPDDDTPGFSQKYSRLELVTNPKAREAQRKFLKQFLTHTNPYRKISYINDPSIIAVEIINEPTHPENGQEISDYINDMVSVLRLAGFTKPIFYNISQNWSDIQANAVTKAKIDGISFQWYPTNLVHQKMLKGNYLPNVNTYHIPSENIAGYSTKAKMVYEFDAADVGGAYIYPAVVRSFCEAGMQFAAMFSYDPAQIAWSNTEYPTHFLNLLYTPSKALSLMIAGKAFHRLPRNKNYGGYPENNQFDDFRVSYEEDLSEMNTDSEFMYSNSTKTHPKNTPMLQHVAGCGNSSIVQYDGTGSYFLDKLESGLWKLELYPDVLWLRDPFESASLSQQVSRLFWNQRHMTIILPDLGNEFKMYSLSDTKWEDDKNSKSGRFLSPGKYLVISKNADKKKLHRYLQKREKFLEGLYTPPSRTPGIYVVNKTGAYSNERHPSVFKFQIASDQPFHHADLYVRRLGWRGFAKHPLKNIGGFDYVVIDSPKIIQSGNLEYCVAVESEGKEYTFPDGVQSTPGKWDFTASNYWCLKVLSTEEPITLFNAARDRKDIVFSYDNRPGTSSIDYKNGSQGDEKSLFLDVSFSPEEEMPFGLQVDVSEYVKPFVEQLEKYQTVVIKARSNRDSLSMFELNFFMQDGKSYGAPVQLQETWHEIEIPLTAFSDKRSLILPNSYPLFLSKIWQNKIGNVTARPDPRFLERIQIIVDPSEIKKHTNARETSFEIVSVILKK